eukprot:4917815-Pyramimonas_sp.AAC.2
MGGWVGTEGLLDLTEGGMRWKRGYPRREWPSTPAPPITPIAYLLQIPACPFSLPQSPCEPLRNPPRHS